MKKFTLFTVLTALLSWTGIIQAQTPTMPELTTDESTPKYYLIKNYRSGGYLTANADGSITHEQIANISANSIWYFTGNISEIQVGDNSTTINQFVGNIKNEGLTGKSLAYTNSLTTTDEGTDWYVRAHKYPTNPSTNGLAISTNADLSTNIDANRNVTSTGTYGGNNQDWDGTTWNVVTLDETFEEYCTKITQILADEGNAGHYGYHSPEAYQELKTTYNTISSLSASIESIKALTDAISTFESSPIVKPVEGYYRFKSEHLQQYLAVNTFGLKSNLSTNDLIVDGNSDLETVWKLEYLDESQNSFTLMNAATGEYINNNTLKTSFAKYPMTFTYNYTGNTDIGTGKVAIKGNNTTLFIAADNQAVSNWSTGIGSVWSIENASLTDYEITDELISKLENLYNNIEKKIYSLNDFKVSMADKSALNSEKNFANYSAYIDAIKNTANQIDENAYYYIISAYKTFDDGIDRYVYVDSEGTLKWTKSMSDEASMLWKLTPETDDFNQNNSYNFTSANFKKNIITGTYNSVNYIGDATNPITIEPSPVGNAKEGGVLLRHYLSGDKHTLALRGSGNNPSVTEHTFGAPTKDEDNLGITTLNLDDANHATHFLLVRAETVKLHTSSTSDGENWCTTYLPVSVQLSTGTTAYYVSSAADGLATLTACDENKIAAEDGAVIKSENAGDITATILSDEVTPVSGNQLSGTLTATDISTDSYILTDGTKGIGFYLVDGSDTKLAGNKAYLTINAASGIKAFTFDLNNGATGIENTEAAAETAEEYYDLQGRRVLNPTKGIYVTKSGKKVLFTK